MTESKIKNIFQVAFYCMYYMTDYKCSNQTKKQILHCTPTKLVAKLELVLHAITLFRFDSENKFIGHNVLGSHLYVICR